MRYTTKLVSTDGEQKTVPNISTDMSRTVESLLRGSVRVIVEYNDGSMLVFEREVK